MSEQGPADLIEVAVPSGLPQALTYSVPPLWRGVELAGRRVRVPLGKRRSRGLVLGSVAVAPNGIEIKPIDEVLDGEPLAPPESLTLLRFLCDYYFASASEAARAVVPWDAPPWGNPRLRLTSAGALAARHEPLEQALFERFLGQGWQRSAEVERHLGDPAAGPLIARWVAEGRLAVDDSRRRGSRYAAAVELPARPLPELLAACGRSAAARQVVETLAAWARPATVSELTATCECSAAVVNRLVSKEVLRSFSQPLRLGLDRHLVAPVRSAALTLSTAQGQALATLREALEERRFAAFLLAGVTGSGKTEVYLRLASASLERGRTVLLLVPEIALVPALARLARERFGDRVAILHSALGAAERAQEWERVRRGEATVVVGPRSAVLAPLPNLGLVVVDEEHDAAYKQEHEPRYHGRDLALLRAQRAEAIAVLVSATPSLEARRLAASHKLIRLELAKRVGGATLPIGKVVDLRQERPARLPGDVVLSAALCAEIETTLAAGEQAILLRNRRGYSPRLLCRACGEEFRCPSCGLPRTYHRRDRRLLCHYCGDRLTAPTRCPACAGETLEPIGAGTERVEEQLAERFPGVPIGVLDRDAVRRQGSLAAILERFGRGETRLLVGTQMVSKGHHFPAVTLTAVLAADSLLGMPDFRSVERTYSQLVQLAGRAGRGERPGRVLVQTYHPEHYAIRAALEHDDALFEREEMRFRRAFHYPPFTRMVQVLAHDRRRERVAGWIAALGERLAAAARAGDGLRITGPAPAPLERLRGEWRFQLLLRGASQRELRRLVLSSLPPDPPRHLVLDADPHHLL